MPLTELPVGTTARVWALDGEINLCSRLRELGFCESAVIERVSGSKTLLCQLCGARIALSDRAAVHIVVEPIASGA
jgi:ferrous iron transport protein A